MNNRVVFKVALTNMKQCVSDASAANSRPGHNVGRRGDGATPFRSHIRLPCRTLGQTELDALIGRYVENMLPISTVDPFRALIAKILELQFHHTELF